ncbi:lantibiotic dehydratase family protein [Streptomyces sp. NRRL F-5123]|uniref:lantibiotic dehydratase family protein n=1 Tax=Streptomyces sp. NRRL F-5123 TaxID=1463856 RepID=UPI001F3F62B8|nr:lantibiotic dehydratase family protein [Streptomyces sp. NRRL F-5123]
MTRSRARTYRGVADGMLRAAASVAGLTVPPWPGADAAVDDWRAWLTAMWADDAFRQAVAGASPDLTRKVESIVAGDSVPTRRARRAALALARYAIRYTGRSTPFGLFAGVAPLHFGAGAEVRVGDRHRAVARPDPVILDEAVSRWEASGERMADVEVCVNNLARLRDGRVVVPSEGAAEISLVLSPAVALVLDTARAPIRCADLAEKLAAEYPRTSEPARSRLLAQLLHARLLRSALRAPATVVDPADVLPAALRDEVRRGPSATDLRLDATVRLPETVLTEAETAATVLARLAMHPAGTEAWHDYTEQFIARYGEGAEVPLEQVTDPGRGLGLPVGFGGVHAPPRVMTRRDRLLLELAGTAAAEGRREVVLSGALIEELEAAAGTRRIAAPHLELCAHVRSCSMHALDRGDFRLEVSTVSRGVGTMTGRFWHLVPNAAAACAELPTGEPDSELVQLSFHAGRVPLDLLTRAPQALPRVLSVGEFRRPREEVLFPADLAVRALKGRLHLVEAATGTRIEPVIPTAVNFVWNNCAPPLARFLAEISRAGLPQVTWFDWGAAWTLPVLPALRHRRTVLVPARWKLRSRDLPGRTASLGEWARELHAWKSRFRMPDRVLLAEDDMQLPLDLRQDMHLDLLRVHLAASATSTASLYEAPPQDADGWIGGRAHSIVVPMAARS